MNQPFEQFGAEGSSRSGIHQRIAAKLRVIGIWVMSFGGMLISCGFALYCVLGVVAMCVHFAPWGLLAMPFFGAGLIISGWHIVATIVALMRARLPAPVQVALMQPQWPRGTRLMIALWWLCHLSMGALMAIASLAERPPEVGVVLLLTGMSAAFTYAAHGFLMLIVTCFTKHPNWVVRAWGWRHVCAVGHGLAVLVAGLVR